MKAYLIDPASKQVEAVDYDGSDAALQRLIGFPTIDSDAIGGGDRLFFDEECFLRATPETGRFQLDTLAPVAGRGVVVGTVAGGTDRVDPAVGPAALAVRVKFA
jgi:hypothetical protein